MPRHTDPPKTALAATVRTRRATTTQGELARAIGLDQKALSRVEQGMAPKAETAAKLARWLGWTTSAVLDAAARQLTQDAPEPSATHEVRPSLGRRLGPDLDEAISALPPDVAAALLRAHQALTELGVRHVIVGGIAVSAHGYVRTTKDVDFLVGDEAFDRPFGDFVTMKPGLPITIRQVAIDYLSPLAGAEMEAVLDAESAAVLRVLPVEMLCLMKLVAYRPKDRVDLTGLLETGLDPEPVRAYLARVAPEQVEKFNRLVAQTELG